MCNVLELNRNLLASCSRRFLPAAAHQWNNPSRWHPTTSTLIDGHIKKRRAPKVNLKSSSEERDGQDREKEAASPHSTANSKSPPPHKKKDPPDGVGTTLLLRPSLFLVNETQSVMALALPMNETLSVRHLLRWHTQKPEAKWSLTSEFRHQLWHYMSCHTWAVFSRRVLCVTTIECQCIHWFISHTHTHIGVCGLGNWGEWWLSDSKRRWRRRWMHLTRLYELEKPQQTEIVISEKRNICDKSWSYTDSIGGLDVEKKLFFPFCVYFLGLFSPLLTWRVFDRQSGRRRWCGLWWRLQGV